MQSIFLELALCSSKNEFGRNDTVFLCLSEVSKCTVSLTNNNLSLKHSSPSKKCKGLGGGVEGGLVRKVRVRLKLFLFDEGGEGSDKK